MEHFKKTVSVSLETSLYSIEIGKRKQLFKEVSNLDQLMEENKPVAGYKTGIPIHYGISCNQLEELREYVHGCKKHGIKTLERSWRAYTDF